MFPVFFSGCLIKSGMSGEMGGEVGGGVCECHE